MHNELLLLQLQYGKINKESDMPAALPEIITKMEEILL